MRPSLAVNLAASTLTAGVPIVAALIATPLIIDAVGKSGFGVWTLVQTIVLYFATAEAGFGPAVNRFVAVARGAGDDDEVRGLMWATLLVYLAAGLLFAAVLALLAPVVVNLFDFPPDLRDDARSLVRLMGPALALTLLAAGLANVLQGLERFPVVATSTAAGAVTFVVVAALALGSGGGLTGLAWAIVAQQGLMALLRFVALRDVARGGPRLVGRATFGRLLRFAVPLQLVLASTIINNQTDRVVVGLIAPVATVGQLGVATQLAEGGRYGAGAALVPVMNRLAATHGEAGHDGLVREYARLNRVWMSVVSAGTTIGLFAIDPLIRGWLGDGFGLAVLLCALLIVAVATNLSTGTTIAYLRAIERPGLEARYGTVLIVLNVALTVLLGLTVGVVGVVSATAGAYLLGTAWFFRRAARERPEIPPQPVPDVVRSALVALPLGAGVLAAGELAAHTLPAGVALLPVLVLAGAALLAACLLQRPVREPLRGLLAARRG